MKSFYRPARGLSGRMGYDLMSDHFACHTDCLAPYVEFSPRSGKVRK
jgi:hypothetical protein